MNNEEQVKNVAAAIKTIADAIDARYFFFFWQTQDGKNNLAAAANSEFCRQIAYHCLGLAKDPISHGHNHAQKTCITRN